MFKKLYIRCYLTHKRFNMYMLVSSYSIEQGAGFKQEIDRILFNRLKHSSRYCACAFTFTNTISWTKPPDLLSQNVKPTQNTKQHVNFTISPNTTPPRFGRRCTVVSIRRDKQTMLLSVNYHVFVPLFKSSHSQVQKKALLSKMN